MKNLLIILTLSLCFTATDFKAQDYNVYNDPYCKGREEGYCEGWKDVKGVLALCPITPVCPVPKVYRTRYLDGYNRGFKKGVKDAEK